MIGVFDLGCELPDSIDRDSLLDSGDINTNWEVWLNMFIEIMETCIPEQGYTFC